MARGAARPEGAQDATRGYRHHPQLARFRSHPEPLAAIAALRGGGPPAKLTETRGQLLYEWRHLKAKLRRRALERPRPHPLFRIVPGKLRDWEGMER